MDGVGTGRTCSTWGGPRKKLTELNALQQVVEKLWDWHMLHVPGVTDRPLGTQEYSRCELWSSSWQCFSEFAPPPRPSDKDIEVVLRNFQPDTGFLESTGAASASSGGDGGPSAKASATPKATPKTGRGRGRGRK